MSTRTPFVNISLLPEDMGRKAARAVAKQLIIKPDSVIGLPTGDTPISMYKELVRIHDENISKPSGAPGKVDFSKATFFNLDEYMGLEKGHPQSYAHYMQNKLFDKIGVHIRSPKTLEGRANIPNGTLPQKDWEKECERYEQAILDAGGMDLLVLGIGGNGHIGFSEPGTPFDRGTHVSKLSVKTRKDNAPQFGGTLENYAMVPEYAITMGPKTIMNARKIIVLANGEKKQEALYNAIKGPVTPKVPASILQTHPDVTFYIDHHAFKDKNTDGTSVRFSDRFTPGVVAFDNNGVKR